MTQSSVTSTDNNHNDILEAARCTVAFCLLYSLTFINVLINKKRSYDAARIDEDKDKKKEYDRYTSPSMRTADRLQANFLEWCPIYFGLMWSLAMTNNLSWVDVVCCRLYIAFRALYIVLILKKGVG